MIRILIIVLTLLSVMLSGCSAGLGYRGNVYATKCCRGARMYLNGETVPGLYAYTRPDIGNVLRKANITDEVANLNSNNSGTKLFVYTYNGVYVLNINGSIDRIPIELIEAQFREAMRPYKNEFFDGDDFISPRNIYLDDTGEVVGIVRSVGTVKTLESILFLKDGKVFKSPESFPVSKDGKYINIGNARSGSQIYEINKPYKLAIDLKEENITILHIYSRDNRLYLVGIDDIYIYKKDNNEFIREKVIQRPFLNVTDIDHGSSKIVQNLIKENIKPEWFLFDMETGIVNSLGPYNMEEVFFLQDDILENVRKRLNQ